MLKIYYLYTVNAVFAASLTFGWESEKHITNFGTIWGNDDDNDWSEQLL